MLQNTSNTVFPLKTHVLTPTTFNSIPIWICKRPNKVFWVAPYSLPKRRFWGYWAFAIRPFHEMLQNPSNTVFPLKTHVLTPTTFNSIPIWVCNGQTRYFWGAPYSLPKRRFWGYWAFAIRPFHEMLQNNSNTGFPLKTHVLTPTTFNLIPIWVCKRPNNVFLGCSLQPPKETFLGILGFCH